MSRPDSALHELKIDRSRGARPAGKRRWPWYAAIALVAVVALFLLRGGKPVAVETVNPRSAAESGPASVLDASGYVTARRIATVSSKVTGKVREVYIEEGQQVAEGEILARLDDQDASAQLDVAQSQVAASRSQLAEAQAQLDALTRLMSGETPAAPVRLAGLEPEARYRVSLPEPWPHNSSNFLGAWVTDVFFQDKQLQAVSPLL